MSFDDDDDDDEVMVRGLVLVLVLVLVGIEIRVLEGRKEEDERGGGIGLGFGGRMGRVKAMEEDNGYSAIRFLFDIYNIHGHFTCFSDFSPLFPVYFYHKQVEKMGELNL